jgi:hypothetical protein
MTGHLCQHQFGGRVGYGFFGSWVLGFSLVKKIDSWIDIVKVRDGKARKSSDIVLN